jgi:hypothetical protein
VADEKTEAPPWYRWHWADFLKSCLGWNFHQRSVYRELLDVQWQEGFVPREPAKCRVRVGCSAEEWAESWPIIEEKFPIRGAGRQNPRLEFERGRALRAAQEATEFGRMGAKARWGDSKEKQLDAIEGVCLPNRVQMADKKILDLRGKNVEVRKDSQTQPLHPESLSSGATSADKYGTRCPNPFPITDDMRAWAAEKFPSADLEGITEEFVDYWTALPKTNRAKKLDWVATWRNRIRDQVARHNRANAPRKTKFAQYTEKLYARQNEK